MNTDSKPPVVNCDYWDNGYRCGEPVHWVRLSAKRLGVRAIQIICNDHKQHLEANPDTDWPNVFLELEQPAVSAEAIDEIERLRAENQRLRRIEKAWMFIQNCEMDRPLREAVRLAYKRDFAE